MSDAPADRRFRVHDDEDGERLDRVVSDRLPEVSRSQFQRVFAADLVRVDDRPRAKSYRVSAGQTVSYTLPEVAETHILPQAMPLAIVYEDDDILVVDKPAGLVTHPAPGHASGTLVNALLHHCRTIVDTGDPRRPGLVHRLDRETSGLLVVALSPRAYRSLQEQLQDRSLGRTYVALAWGAWPESGGTLVGAIDRHPRDRQRMAVVTRGGREAVTHFEVLADLGFVQLCRVKLDTGRTHQIRVHFTHHGHPLVGDPVYGDDRRARNVRPVDRAAAAQLVKAVHRQFLHAHVLELRHPSTGEMRRFEAPLPADLAMPLRRLCGQLDLPWPPSLGPAPD